MTNRETQALRAVLTVTVETRPDGGHYFDQADFTAHVAGWVRSALRDKHAVGGVTVDEQAAVSVVPPATNQTAEEHRLALSEALGLGTGAPWDAIHDRVTELGLPPLDRDPVARRLGLLAAYRATILTEAADLVAALDRRKTVIAADTIKDAWEEGRDEGADLLRRLAAEAPHTETPDAPAVVAQPGKDPS